MLRVCHIASGDLWAGAEVMVSQLVAGLRTYLELRLDVVLLNEGKLATEIRDCGVKVHVLDEKRLSFLSLASGLYRILSACKPDILHSHRYKENFLGFMMSLRFPGMKLVSTQHGMPELGKSGDLVHRLLRKMNNYCQVKGFDKVVTVSQDMRRRYLTEYGHRESRTVAIHNGIRMPDRFAARQGERGLRIGSCGRLFPVKDYPLMVEVARQVVSKNRDVKFVLAGDGPDMDKIRGLVEKYGLGENFRLLGHVDDMRGFYQSIDVFINTSVHEGIPMSILEAMAYGVPVVAPAVGGIPEIIDDQVDGFLVKEREAGAFAVVCDLLSQDHDLRMAISAAAKDKAKREFSVEMMASRYHQLYHALCS
jgi:L-malate glycosyltransferase